MKLNTSKNLVIGATLIFTAFVVLKFLTIQGMDTNEENYHLYHIEGEELFSVSNKEENTFVEIEDDDRVSIRGFFKQEGEKYKVLPYSFIDINSSKGSLTYQFLADNRKKSFSYPVRFRKFELIGGSRFGYLNSLARLEKKDRPLLILFPEKSKPIFGKTNQGIRIIALQEGLVYLDKQGKSTPLPLFDGNIHELEKAYKKGELFPLPIEDDGVISSINQNLVLNLTITDGVVSKKIRGGYKEVPTKYINITKYSDFSEIKKLVLSYASKEFYITKDDGKTYLDAPYEIPIDKKIVVKGKDALFGFAHYFGGADFSTNVPRLDKPKIEKKKANNSRYYDYLDIDNMYGIYVSDENAKVYYSRDKKRWIKAVENYKYSPPLYLYDATVKGQYIAPKAFRKTKGKIYYKVVSTLESYTIAFNGKLEVESKSGQNLSKQVVHYYEPIVINNKEVVITAKKEPLEECGILFSLNEEKNFSYRFMNDDATVKRDFEIEKNGDEYVYRIKEILNPFKQYKIDVKGYKKIEYRPQLTCKYRSKSKEQEVQSLYTTANTLSLIPKAPSRKAKNITLELMENNNSKNMVNAIPKELIPIYGDGIRFGLLSNGVSMDELTIDKEFSLKVANIFTKKIEPLLNSKRVQSKLKKNSETIEGATVVIKIDEDGNREIVSLFSYPYPKSSDAVEEALIVDTLNNRASTIQNRALDMLVHPGSTFKMVTSIALAQEGKLDDITELKGRTDIYGTPFGESSIGFHLKNYTGGNGITETTAETDFKASFTESYNTYFGYSGLKLHERLNRKYSKNLFPILLDKKERDEEFSLIKVAQQLYFNKPIPLSVKAKIYARASQFPSIFTSPKEVADSAIGQYEVYATPLQMAIVGSVLYDNKLQLPKILKESLVDTDNQEVTQEQNQGFFSSIGSIFNSEKNLEVIQEAMHDVTLKGTAKKAFRTFKSDKCKVYGKTGTAQKGKKGLYDGWFVSFTKGLKEDIVIATVVRNSGTGGSYSAPINRKIIEAWIKKEEGE